MIGGLLSSAVDREEIVLATKAGISRRTGERVVDTSRRALLDSLDGSLVRLGTDHVDLWQVHAWSDGLRVPVYDRNKIAPGQSVKGPAIIEERETTTVIPPDWTATVDKIMETKR